MGWQEVLFMVTFASFTPPSLPTSSLNEKSYSVAAQNVCNRWRTTMSAIAMFVSSSDAGPLTIRNRGICAEVYRLASFLTGRWFSFGIAGLVPQPLVHSRH